jgi:UDP-GlcNAc3NAcA epimerase
VYGDTNSTLAGALSASKLHIPVAHVEAGLRSFNRRMPEEINRIVTDHTSDLLFAPTSTAVAHLSREGIPMRQISLVGDVMYDAALFYASRALSRQHILRSFGVEPHAYLLATIHRAENTDEDSRLRAICEALLRVSRDLPVIFPVHPRTRKKLVDIGVQLGNLVRLIDPVGYLHMVALEMNAKVIATDSGGVQKEAYFYRVPCVTLRDETEWVELVELGWNRLVRPVDADVIARELLGAAPPPGDSAPSPFGNGDSAKKIRDELLAKGG